MRFLLYFLIFGLTYSLSFPSYSLDFREKLKGSIVKISTSQNRFIIDKGTDDGVQASDMVKVFIGDNIIGTALAIDMRSNMSEWVFYQIYNWNHYTEGVDVELISLFGEKRPKVYQFSKYQKNSLLSQLLAKERKRREEEIEAKKTKNAKDEQIALEKRQKSLSNQPTPYGHTLPDFRLKLSLSPFLLRPHDRGKEIHYNLSTENLDQREQVIFMEYEYGHESFKSRIPSNSSRMSEYHGKGIYEKKEFYFNKADYTSLLSFKKKSEGSFKPTRSQVRIGVLGIKYNFKEELWLKYIPLREYYSGDRLSPKEGQSPVSLSLSNPNKYQEESRNTWRHYLELYFSKDFMNQKLKLSNSLSIAPSQKSFFQKLDFKDLDLHEITSLGIQVFPNFMFTLISDYSFDMRRKLINDMPATEWGWRVTLSYDMDFINTSL